MVSTTQTQMPFTACAAKDAIKYKIRALLTAESKCSPWHVLMCCEFEIKRISPWALPPLSHMNSFHIPLPLSSSSSSHTTAHTSSSELLSLFLLLFCPPSERDWKVCILSHALRLHSVCSAELCADPPLNIWAVMGLNPTQTASSADPGSKWCGTFLWTVQSVTYDSSLLFEHTFLCREKEASLSQEWPRYIDNPMICWQQSFAPTQTWGP